MTQVLALAARQMETVAAPVHRHVDLGKQFKPSAGFIAAGGRHSPTHLRTTPSRKRASTTSAVGAHHGMLDSPYANAAGAQKQDWSRDIVCLCTPAPKIPRPRNAFILYRQHHQAQVTADNPKLSNPDISKIIGEKWKNEAEEGKQYWKKLAEEEKTRHQNQYPHYRYQPRRGNKPKGGWTTTSPTEEQSRCPKCNGRAMVTPQTPLTPFATSSAGKTGAAPQGRSSLQRLDTSLSRRSSFEQLPTSTVPFPSKLPIVRDVDSSDPLSPEMKRRRANTAGSYHAINGPLGSYGSRQRGDLTLTPTEGPPNPLQSYARTPLPELGNLTRSQSGPMPPPLRPSVSTSWLGKDQQNRRHSGFDESLRLPPLQTAVLEYPSRTSVMDTRHVSLPMAGLNVFASREAPDPRARTSEEMVMSISFKRKIAVLASICQPAPPVGRDSIPGDTRGAFIAVEGPNAKLLQEVGNAIEKGLAACGDVVLKAWRDESSYGQNTTGGDTGEASQPGRGGGTKFGDAFEPYIKAILWWQKKSKEIGRHITGKTALLPSTDEKRADGERIVSQAQVKETGNLPEDDKGPAPSAKIPVALAKEGFSLTISERYACAMPILDMYTPADHWQWMATLWRGTVCPDLIVYVMPSEEEENRNRRTVELLRRMGLIVVKVPAGKGLDEGTERRLAFEVMEWMREGSFRENLPKDWRSNSP
ncbi:Repressor of filamentous growth 1 [Tolypocladium ophioglossoides CBS 100239]|uniref:Repressor of filamentous growth 1 n=1 Tax=Tolypocladium ophioglossoides (strain CBS 100239) TaxID=1163406 RepID=A0A0L0NKA4_TOLOC|nr:Repressor of filamentous growth 1 [Tolypocladium ophioglossoides CBS 100239]